MTKIDCVLPLAVVSHDGDEIARAEILIESLEKFFDRDSLGRLLIVCEAGKAKEILDRLLPGRSIPVEVIDERFWIGRVATPKGVVTSSPGWWRQQLVKLAAADHVATDFYLVLDADVVLRKAVSSADLIPGGRGLVSVAPKSIHPYWWSDSAATLQLPLEWTQSGISVTPQILCREIVWAIRHRLHKVHGGEWLDVLAATHRWTEFTLYDLTARHSGLFDRRHEVGWMTDPACNLYRNGDRERWAFRRNANGFFTIIQSNSGITPAEVRRKIGGLLA